MTKKLPKIKLHLNLQQILLLILVLTLALEGFVVYRAFYAPVRNAVTQDVAAPGVAQKVSLDLVQYNKVTAWIDENRAYQLPAYQFRIATGTATTTIFYGRENPFAQ